MADKNNLRRQCGNGRDAKSLVPSGADIVKGELVPAPYARRVKLALVIRNCRRLSNVLTRRMARAA